MMAADFKENGRVEIHPSLPQELYGLLIKHAIDSGQTIDQAVERILSVALEHDAPTFQRLAEADRLREEAEAKAEELKALVASYEHRISWFTNCANCATILDSSIKETERAEKAEAKLAEAVEFLRKYHLRMAGGDERTHQIGMELLATTEGPWWYDENEHYWRMHGIGGRIPASEHIGEQIMNHQIVKVAKHDRPYAEYWPNKADSTFIVNSWSNVAFLLTELQHAKNKVDFLLKMPRRIYSAIGLACPTPDDEHAGDHCDFGTAAVVALKVGQIMRDELRTMDEIVPVDPTPEPS